MISVNPSLISSGVLASFRYSSAMRLLAEEAWNREDSWTIISHCEAVMFFYRTFFESISKRDDVLTLSTTDMHKKSGADGRYA